MQRPGYRVLGSQGPFSTRLCVSRPRGRRTVKVVPDSAVEVTSIVPPWAVTM